MTFRSNSAPPVEKFLLEDDVELDEIQFSIKYSNYYKKHKDPRLEPPKLMFKGQHSPWAYEHKDFILNAFSEKRTGVEMINSDYPESGSCIEFSGRSNTTTPVGDKPLIIPELIQKCNISIPVKVTNSSKNSISTTFDASKMIEGIQDFYQKMGKSALLMDDEIVEDMKFEDVCVLVCKDQDGSRFIQGEIDNWSKEQITYFFNQISSFSYDLSTNLFGNYVIQKLVPFLDEECVFLLILQFFGHICELSLHVYGCRVIQKLIDQLDDIKSIVAELENHVDELIFSPNGNHVIQKCIDKDIEKDFLIKEFEKETIKLATQRYGCRVLQRLFEVCSERETWNVYLKVIDNIDVLINDKYGNYVIQHLIDSENKYKMKIFDYIVKNAFRLSKDKFSSNVVEKCVNTSSPEYLEQFLGVFSKIQDDNKPCLYFMCIDMFGNYVVQRFFDVAGEDLKNRAKSIIKPFVREMKSIPFTKHILTRIL